MMRLIAGFLWLALSFHPLLAEDSYEVRMHRPVKLGDRFQLSAKVAVDVTTVTLYDVDDADDDSVEAGCKITGELTVLGVTPKGLAKELRFKLSEAQCMEDGKAAAFFKAGDVIYLRHGDPEPVVQVNGAEPEPAQSEIIDAFLFVHGDENATDDELLGSTQKVKPGDSWPVNRDAMLKDWQQAGFSGLKADDFKGATTLSEITNLQGNPAARLSGDFRIENVGMRQPSLPKDFQAKRFHLEVHDETDLPLDPADTATSSKSQMKLESDSAGFIDEDGKQKKVRVSTRQRSAAEVTLTPLK